MRLADSFIAELEAEAAATRRVLERVPEAHLAWKPHEKSSSLGQLALHVASLPERLTGYLAAETLDITTRNRRQPAPASLVEIMTAFDTSLSAARASFAALDDVRAGEVWRLVAGDTGGFRAARAAGVRRFVLKQQ